MRIIHIEVLIHRCEGVLVILVLRDGQHRRILRLRAQHTVSDRGGGGFQLILIVINRGFRGHDLAVFGVVDHHPVAGVDGISLHVLVHQLVDLDGDRQLVAVRHAVLGGLDGVGLDLGSLDGPGVLLILRARGLIVELRALGSAGELDLRADLDLRAVRYVRSRSSDLFLLCRFQLIERELMRIATGCRILIRSELVAALLIAGQRHGIIASTLELELAIRKFHSPVILSILNTVIIAARRRNGFPRRVRQLNAVLADRQRPNAGFRVHDFVLINSRLDSGDPSAVQCPQGIAIAGHQHIFAGHQLLFLRDLHIGLLRRLRCEDRGGQQGQSHHQGHQQRT